MSTTKSLSDKNVKTAKEEWMQTMVEQNNGVGNGTISWTPQKPDTTTVFATSYCPDHCGLWPIGCGLVCTMGGFGFNCLIQ